MLMLQMHSGGFRTLAYGGDSVSLHTEPPLPIKLSVHPFIYNSKYDRVDYGLRMRLLKNDTLYQILYTLKEYPMRVLFQRVYNVGKKPDRVQRHSALNANHLGSAVFSS